MRRSIFRTNLHVDVCVCNGLNDLVFFFYRMHHSILVFDLDCQSMELFRAVVTFLPFLFDGSSLASLEHDTTHLLRGRKGRCVCVCQNKKVTVSERSYIYKRIDISIHLYSVRATSKAMLFLFITNVYLEWAFHFCFRTWYWWRTESGLVKAFTFSAVCF